MLISKVITLLSIVGAFTTATPTDVEKRATGFVTRSGRGFVMNGEPFYFVGTNAYWATGLSSEDLTSLFTQMNAAGMKVLRIFGFSDNVGGPENGYLQYWEGSNNTPNPAAFAAQIDPIINGAEAAGIKIVIPMIDNWGPSINTYIQQILGSSATHDTFYTNSQIISAYKKFVNFFVNRYINSPAVFAWELMNEPQCAGDDGRSSSSACGAPMVTSWIQTMSSYIKSIDSQHMVTVGDEGWFSTAQGYGSTIPYNKAIDWVTNLQISTVDYGTVHMYPDSWGEPDSWGSQWITDHAQQANTYGKPVVLEEFGTTNANNRYNILTSWLDTAYSGNFNGVQYWQFVGSFPSGYQSPNDGNGISTSESSYNLIKSLASQMNAKSGGSGNSSPTTTSTKPTSSSTSGSGGTVAHWGQCGGIGWTGGTVCQSPYTCQFSNDWYSQCL